MTKRGSTTAKWRKIIKLDNTPTTSGSVGSIPKYGAFVIFERINARSGSGGIVRSTDYIEGVNRAFAALDRGDNAAALAELRAARGIKRMGEFNSSYGYIDKRSGGRTRGARNKINPNETLMKLMDSISAHTGSKRPFQIARKALKGTVEKAILDDAVRKFGNMWKKRHGIGS